MKILFINRWVGYNEGGNETHIKELISQFSIHGDEVTVITTVGDKLDFVKDKVDLRFVSAPKSYYSYSAFGIIFALLFNIKCFFLFLKMYLLDHKRFDLISVHFSLEAYLARFIKLLFGIPYVMVMAGDQFFELVEGKRADGVIQISKFMNEQCLKHGYSAEIIPKGFDLQKFKPGWAVSDLRHEYALENKKVILTVCRLDPRKNLSTLIESANIIVNQKHVTDIVFLIIGDGVERALLNDLIRKYNLEDYVKLVGSISNTGDLLPKYYNLADLFVLPTLHEGFGWVYLEAMACGLPILTTNVSSNPEIVGGVGELIPPKDATDLAEKTLKLTGDSHLLSQMKKKGLERAQQFNWDNIFGKYQTYYLEVSKKRAGIVARLQVAKFIIQDSVTILLHLSS